MSIAVKGRSRVETEQSVTRFAKLSSEGLHAEQVTNPVLSTLLKEQSGQSPDKNALIRPEDEWLIFPD